MGDPPLGTGPDERVPPSGGPDRQVPPEVGGTRLSRPRRRGILVMPDKLQWMIKRNSADLIGRFLQGSEGRACRAWRIAICPYTIVPQSGGVTANKVQTGSGTW
jgi:hypothetical protein